MIGVSHGVDERCRLLLAPVGVPRLLIPLGNYAPEAREGVVVCELRLKCRADSSDANELVEIVLVARDRPSLVRKVVLIRATGDAGLKGALDGVTGKIIGT